MSGVYCGLCEKAVMDWEDHVSSEEHQRNLLDPSKTLLAYIQSKGEMIEGINEIMKKKRKRPK